MKKNLEFEKKTIDIGFEHSLSYAGKCGENPPLPRNCDRGRKPIMPLSRSRGMGRRVSRMILKSGYQVTQDTRITFEGEVG
jgi:hypothetical protein